MSNSRRSRDVSWQFRPQLDQSQRMQFSLRHFAFLRVRIKFGHFDRVFIRELRNLLVAKMPQKDLCFLTKPLRAACREGKFYAQYIGS